MFYAQINQENIVFAITQSAGVIDAPDMIPMEFDDASVMGKKYENGQFVAPPAPPAPPPEPPKPYATLIDIGPFYDRFGAAKMAVLTSADPAIRAILSDLNIRKWVDLARPDVAQAVQYVGSVVTQVTPELQATILSTTIAPEENLALRKLYFS